MNDNKKYTVDEVNDIRLKWFYRRHHADLARRDAQLNKVAVLIVMILCTGLGIALGAIIRDLML